MPAILKFPADAVRDLLDHAFAASRHRLTFAERMDIYGDDVFDHQPNEEKHGKPGLWLVKDHGIYLMSNGFPGQPSGNGPDLQCVYAIGYDPHTDDDVWQACRAALGGDDFCDVFPAEDIRDVLKSGDRFLTIRASETSYSYRGEA